MSEPVSAYLIISTIAVLVVVSALGVILVNKGKK